MLWVSTKFQQLSSRLYATKSICYQYLKKYLNTKNIKVFKYYLKYSYYIEDLNT